MKRILKFLTGTKDLDLWYPWSDGLELVGYLDADYVGYKVDKKSTPGHANSLDKLLCHGIPTSKSQFPCPLLRLNLLLYSKTVDQHTTQWPWIALQKEPISSVTIDVLSRSIIILYDPIGTPRPCILKWNCHFIGDHREKSDIFLNLVPTNM